MFSDDNSANAVMALGLFVIAKLALAFLTFIYRKFLRGGKNLTKLGKWAVVTGATDGIGKAMAAELAKKGLNIVLISRTQSKLDDVQKEILAKKPTLEVKTIAVDFNRFASGNRQDPAVGTVKQALDGLEIAVLVNNVGVSYEYPERYDKLDDDRAQALVELNINATNWMTRAVLPGMVARKKGAVVTIASAAGMFPSPMLAGYSAAKCWANMFMKALSAEYGHLPNLTFQSQTPLMVVSKLSKRRRAAYDTPTPEVYARAAVKAIGYEVECSPFWVHQVQQTVLTSLPDFVQNKILVGMHEGIRKAALRKMEREAKKDN